MRVSTTTGGDGGGWVRVVPIRGRDGVSSRGKGGWSWVRVFPGLSIENTTFREERRGQGGGGFLTNSRGPVVCPCPPATTPLLTHLLLKRGVLGAGGKGNGGRQSPSSLLVLLGEE